MSTRVLLINPRVGPLYIPPPTEPAAQRLYSLPQELESMSFSPGHMKPPEGEKKKRQCRAQINLKRVRGDGQVNRASGCHTSLYFCQTPTESQRCKVRTVCCESVTQRRDGNIPCEKWNFIFLLLSRNISQYIITKLIC